MFAKLLFPAAVSVCAIALTSCGSVKDASAKVGGSVKSVGSVVGKGISSLTGPNIDVVEVDPNALARPLTGREKALAFEKKQQRMRQARLARKRERSLPMPDLDDPMFDGLPALEDVDGGGLLPSKPAS